jgi:hypothetical protein
MSSSSNLSSGILKTAAPGWFYQVHQKMQPKNRAHPGYSFVGLQRMLARRGIK